MLWDPMYDHSSGPCRHSIPIFNLWVPGGSSSVFSSNIQSNAVRIMSADPCLTPVMTIIENTYIFVKVREGKEVTGREGTGREGKGREGREGTGRNGREGRGGKEGKGRDGKGRKGKGWKGREAKGREGKESFPWWAQIPLKMDGPCNTYSWKAI